MTPTDEEITEKANKTYNHSMASMNESVQGPPAFEEGAKWMRQEMTEELEANIELGKCECGREHDIRYMVESPDGNDVCFECFTAWASTYDKHIRELLKMRAAISVTKVPDEPLRYMALIDKIGEDYTNCGEGWEEIVQEWEDL